jgi:hypothetical protein
VSWRSAEVFRPRQETKTRGVSFQAHAPQDLVGRSTGACVSAAIDLVAGERTFESERRLARSLIAGEKITNRFTLLITKFGKVADPFETVTSG